MLKELTGYELEKKKTTKQTNNKKPVKSDNLPLDLISQYPYATTGTYHVQEVGHTENKTQIRIADFKPTTMVKATPNPAQKS